MYDTKFKRHMDPQGLTVILAEAFIAFALVLIILLWFLQVGLLDSYYSSVMGQNCETALSNAAKKYSGSPELDMAEFKSELENITDTQDIYFYIQSPDGRLLISSTDDLVYGRGLVGEESLGAMARERMEESGSASIDFEVENSVGGGNVLIVARKVDSPYRDTVYLCCFANVSPMHSTTRILSSQLFMVCFISMVIGCMFAMSFANRVASPIVELKVMARRMAAGDPDLDFRMDPDASTEILELADTLQNTSIEMAKTSRLQKDLMANVSHDLRTPLTMIKSYAELIRDISGDDKERRDKHLEIIIDETDRLSDLVGDILTLSKLQAGSEEFESKPVDIQSAASGVLNIYRVMEESEGFSLDFEPLDKKINVLGDERRLQQVISNFMSNAIRYGGEKKQVCVSFSESDGRIICSVSDHGPGIDPEDMENIWNRYEKASARGTRAADGGTGLGLSIAKEILVRHGATYGVESVPGKGSRFWFGLPEMETVD